MRHDGELRVLKASEWCTACEHYCKVVRVHWHLRSEGDAQIQMEVKRENFRVYKITQTCTDSLMGHMRPCERWNICKAFYSSLSDWHSDFFWKCFRTVCVSRRLLWEQVREESCVSPVISLNHFLVCAFHCWLRKALMKLGLRSVITFSCDSILGSMFVFGRHFYFRFGKWSM